MTVERVTIYVALLEEGVDVWRPVAAVVEAGGYRIVDNAPDDERWAFEQGALVACDMKSFSGGAAGLAAVAVIEPRPLS